MTDEGLYRQLVEHLPEALWMADLDSGQVIYTSPALAKIWGRPIPDPFQPASIWLDAIHPDDRERVMATLPKRVRAEYDERYRIQWPDGSIHWIRERMFLIRDEQGQAQHICGITQDITEWVLAQQRLKRQLEERAREIERRWQVAESLYETLTFLNSNRPLSEILDHIVVQADRLLNAGAAAIYHLREDGQSLYIQASYRLDPDYSADADVPIGQAVTGRAVLDRRPVALSDVACISPHDNLVLDPQRRALLARLARHFRALLAVPLIDKNDRSYGTITLYYREPHTFSDEEIQLAVSFSHQTALAIENARLRHQAEQLAVVQERQRLARELHDSVTQALYSAALYAEAASLALSAGKHRVVEDNLQELQNMTRGAMIDMRALIFELHPPMLEDAGLAAALQARLAAVESRAGLQTDIRLEGEGRLPLQLEEELFWIALEALNNVIKHAQARQVTIDLSFDAAHVCLTIADDGRGFDRAMARASGGMGLRGIEERVQRIQGCLEISSTPGEGTVLRVEAEI